ncbi:MAG: aminotransferase class V-fold PLP-dependent enzyme [Armatimonadota bacterium]|nr:aminotransferase class V-fold PLP-dependent enzyme [Armatimonadota bacterium]
MMNPRLLRRTLELATHFLDTLPGRRVGATATREMLRASLGGSLPDSGEDPLRVTEALAQAADPGLVATAGPRYFGFVIGGSVPAALAADWLTSAWDQNAGLFVSSPAASVVEEIAGAWVLDLLGLPGGASIGFVTGATMANFTSLAAARHEVLRRAGWAVEENGLIGAPSVHVVVGDEVHVTVLAALRMLGLGAGRVHRVPADAQGRMRADELRRMLPQLRGPLIVCAQAGNVNTGAFDPLDEIAIAAHEQGAWVHVDGAFGLWAAASPTLRTLVRGSELADSWAVDAHKWLNVPYDSGLAIVANPAPHRAAMSGTAAYLMQAEGAERDPFDWTPEFSRRARGFAIYAALRSLGRRGIAEMIERSCHHARRLAEELAKTPRVQILNDVVLNQVLVRFLPPDAQDADAFTRAVVERVQRDGTCWLGGTIWHGQAAMRVSVSGWSTTEDDIARTVSAIRSAAAASHEPAAPEGGDPGSRKHRSSSVRGVSRVALWRSKSGKVELLRNVPLFRGLSQRQLEQVVRLADEVEVPAGKRLATAGETGHELFVIVRGEAVVRLPNGRTARLKPGEFFGEMSLVDGGPRSAHVDAISPMTLLVIGHREFWSLLNEVPPMAGKIMRTLSQRLRDAERAPTA